jgi:hypothetical protein
MLMRAGTCTGWACGCHLMLVRSGVGRGVRCFMEWARSVGWLGWIDCATGWSE